MNIYRKEFLSAFLCFIVVGASSAQGAVLFNLFADRLDTVGGTASPTSTLIMLVADTQNDGFASVSAGNIQVGSFIDGIGGDDMILYRSDLSIFSTPGVLFENPELTFSGNWGAGDRLGLFWFPTLTTSSTTASVGNSYGSFVSGYQPAEALNGSSVWITPAEGTNGYSLIFYTTDGTTLGPGSHSAASGDASQTVVPEPSVCLLLVVSGALLLAHRRRPSPVSLH